MNLLRNAFEANQETGGTRISITARSYAGNQIDIVIEDSGPGVAPELEAKLFDFFMTTKPDGLGIGLPISRSIVEANGGRLVMKNCDGGGARFCIILPSKPVPDECNPVQI